MSPLTGHFSATAVGKPFSVRDRARTARCGAELVAETPALVAAIGDATDQFEDPVSRLAEAASHAEQVIATAEGATDQ